MSVFLGVSGRVKKLLPDAAKVSLIGGRKMNVLLIDGYNLGFRCFYAMPDLSRADGFPTGALHAFFASLLKLSAEAKPDAVAVFFDKGGSQRHLKIHPQYKANRIQAPENFRKQIPAMKRLCGIFGFYPTESEGIEADDLLASVAVRERDLGNTVFIASADKDFAQLVGLNIRQMLPPTPKNKEWTLLDSIGIKGKFGVSPAQIPDYLSLIGDSADNIEGISGVGPKTAAKWLKDFGDLETIIKRYDWLKPEKFRPLIKDGEALLRRNLELIRFDTSFETQLPQPKVPSFGDIMAFLEEMEMKKSVTNLRKFAQERYSLSL